MIVRLVHRILLKKIFNKQVFMSLVTIKNKEGDWYTVSFFLNQVYI